jgi:hypothetical protein
MLKFPTFLSYALAIFIICVLQACGSSSENSDGVNPPPQGQVGSVPLEDGACIAGTTGSALHGPLMAEKQANIYTGDRVGDLFISRGVFTASEERQLFSYSPRTDTLVILADKGVQIEIYDEMNLALTEENINVETAFIYYVSDNKLYRTRTHGGTPQLIAETPAHLGTIGRYVLAKPDSNGRHPFVALRYGNSGSRTWAIAPVPATFNNNIPAAPTVMVQDSETMQLAYSWSKTQIFRPEFVADNSHFIYVSKDMASGQWQLFSYRFTDGKTLRLDQSLPTATGLASPTRGFNFLVLPAADQGSMRVVYVAAETEMQAADKPRYELFLINADGSKRHNLTADMSASGSVNVPYRSPGVWVNPTASHLFFAGDYAGDNLKALMSVDLSAPNTAAVRLSGQLNISTILYPSFTQKGDKVLFADNNNFYLAAIDGSSAAFALTQNADEVYIGSTFISHNLTSLGDALIYLESPPGTASNYKNDNDRLMIIEGLNSKTPSAPRPLTLSPREHNLDPEASEEDLNDMEFYSGTVGRPFFQVQEKAGLVAYRVKHPSGEHIYLAPLTAAAQLEPMPQPITPLSEHSRGITANFWGMVDNQYFFSSDNRFWASYELHAWDTVKESRSHVSGNFPTHNAADVTRIFQSIDGYSLAAQSHGQSEHARQDLLLIDMKAETSCAVDFDTNVNSRFHAGKFSLDGLEFYFTRYNELDTGAHIANVADCSVRDIDPLLPQGWHTGGHRYLKVSPDGENFLMVEALPPQDGSSTRYWDWQLFTIDKNGNQRRRIGGDFIPGGGIPHGDYWSPGYNFTRDGKSVLYMADAEFEGSYELYAVDFEDAKATPVKLSGDLTAGEYGSGTTLETASLCGDEALSPDGRFVTFARADSRYSSAKTEIYVVPADGSAAPRLIDPSATLGHSNFYRCVKWLPDSSGFIVNENGETYRENQYYFADLSGYDTTTGPITALITLGAHPDFDTPQTFIESQDRSFVLFYAKHITEEQSYLLRSDVRTGVVTPLVPSLKPGLPWRMITPDGKYIITQPNRPYGQLHIYASDHSALPITLEFGYVSSLIMHGDNSIVIRAIEAVDPVDPEAIRGYQYYQYDFISKNLEVIIASDAAARIDSINSVPHLSGSGEPGKLVGDSDLAHTGLDELVELQSCQ